MTLVEDLKALVVQGGISTNNIFLDYRPDEPNKTISIFDTGGEPPREVLSDINRTVQVSIREETKEDSLSLAWDVFNILENPNNRFFIVNSRKMKIKAMQPPTFIYEDTRNRFITNFNLEIVTTGD